MNCTGDRVVFEWSCYINTKQHLKFNLCVRGMKMKAWPKTKLQKRNPTRRYH